MAVDLVALADNPADNLAALADVVPAVVVAAVVVVSAAADLVADQCEHSLVEHSTC